MSHIIPNATKTRELDSIHHGVQHSRLLPPPSPHFEINDYLGVLAEEQKNYTLSEASGHVLLVWVTCLQCSRAPVRLRDSATLHVGTCV
jgi:hypothetical protein